MNKNSFRIISDFNESYDYYGNDECLYFTDDEREYYFNWGNYHIL